MQVRDRLVKEVALELGLSQKKAREIVQAQCLLIRKVMKSKQPKSVYLRKVGLFMSRALVKQLAQERYKRNLNKVKTTKDLEDPFEFI